ncbi:MAG: alpha-L-fucosidase [Saprospiraceae bacterium]
MTKTTSLQKLPILACLLLFGSSSFHAQTHPYIPDHDPLVQQNLAAWQDLKFGFMMHWGAYSQWGVVESWSLCSEDWIDRNGADYMQYVQKYEALPKTFNPTKFNPEKWAAAAKEAGMKYVVFTTKHHDGFCMFDSKYTDYKITGPDCPFHTNPKADVTKYIFDAFRQQDFKIGAYFSKPDWHCDDYWAHEWATPNRCNNYDIRRYPKRWQQYEDFTYNQIGELMSKYGKVDILWLDGGWVRPDSTITEEVISWGYDLPKWGQAIDMQRIARMARQQQPGILIVDRSVHGPYENYRTPEQQVPDKTLPYPWETCMTMAGGWSYSFNPQYKSTRQLVQTLVDIVAKGGNFLLNAAPGPDGELDDEAYLRLKEIGEWMALNGEAIYATRPIAPYKEGKVCLTQKKDGKTLYAIYLPDEDEQEMPSKIWMSSLALPKYSQVKLMGSQEALHWEAVGKGFVVDIPEQFRKKPYCKWAWVLEIRG